MHNGMQYDPIQGQGHEPFKVGNVSRHLQWELATYHGFLNWGTISTFDQAGFLILSLVFVSCDFEVGRNVSCKESTVSPRTGLIFYWLDSLHLMLCRRSCCLQLCIHLTVSHMTNCTCCSSKVQQKQPGEEGYDPYEYDDEGIDGNVLCILWRVQTVNFWDNWLSFLFRCHVNVITSGHRILTKGCIACRAVIDNWVIPYAAYMATETFSGLDDLRNVWFPCWILTPI